jgi:hypothetical protein
MDRGAPCRAPGANGGGSFEAQTQPLLTDLPSRDPPGAEEDNPLAEIRVGSADGYVWASVPVRNVGNATALVQNVIFLADGEEADGEVTNEVVPKGESARLLLILERVNGSPSFTRWAEMFGQPDRDFSVLVGYADASGRPRGALRFDVRKRQIVKRRLADAVEQLRQAIKSPDASGRTPFGP